MTTTGTIDSPSPAATPAAATEPGALAEAYDGYEAWKGWDAAGFMQASAADRDYFARELPGLPLAGEAVLEIGFGSGTFLAWAREAGATLYGTEVSAQGRALAAERGVTILPLDLEEAARTLPGRFALIAAFDVLEHVAIPDIEVMLDRIATLLRPGGRFIARFPNGQSPLGRLHQHADITHVTILSGPMIEQIVAGTRLRLVRHGNSAVPITGGLLKRWAGGARARLRGTLEGLVRRLYGTDAPLGPNLTIILERTA